MSYRTIRRRWGEAMAAHDWLEGVSVVVGVVFFLLAAVCAWALVTDIASWGQDPAPGLADKGEGLLVTARVVGLLLFSVLGLVAFGVGWFLAGDGIRRILRRDRKAA